MRVPRLLGLLFLAACGGSTGTGNGDDSDQPCMGAECGEPCPGGLCACDGIAYERALEARPLDVYLVLDGTNSMGRDCAYHPGTPPPVGSKACYATYALADYVSTVAPVTPTTLAFGVMSLSDACDGSGYDPPIVAASPLPVAVNSPLVQRVSDETFSGGFGTRIEGALRGIAAYTTAYEVAEREMIGVLITDGDATDCETSTHELAEIIAAHRAASGIRTFLIGMEGASEATLEQLARAGGADPHDDFCGGLAPPCHFWSVGDGSGAALEAALRAIAAQAVPLPCDLDITGLMPAPGESLDYGEVNVTFTENGATTTFIQVPDAAACPANAPAWYYDDPTAPTRIHLCPGACAAVGAAGDGATLEVVVGCTTIVE